MHRKIPRKLAVLNDMHSDGYFWMIHFGSVWYGSYTPVERSASDGCQAGKNTQVCHVLGPRLDVQVTWRHIRLEIVLINKRYITFFFSLLTSAWIITKNDIMSDVFFIRREGKKRSPGSIWWRENHEPWNRKEPFCWLHLNLRKRKKKKEEKSTVISVHGAVLQLWSSSESPFVALGGDNMH